MQAELHCRYDAVSLTVTLLSSTCKQRAMLLTWPATKHATHINYCLSMYSFLTATSAGWHQELANLAAQLVYLKEQAGALECGIYRFSYRCISQQHLAS
jgi:hypothetical protein